MHVCICDRVCVYVRVSACGQHDVADSHRDMCCCIVDKHIGDRIAPPPPIEDGVATLHQLYRFVVVVCIVVRVGGSFWVFSWVVRGCLL